MSEKVLYTELTPQEFRARLAAAPIAYLPLGTLEWHGEHLPLGTDGLISEGFFVRLAQRVGGIVLPMLFLGPCRRESRPDGSELYGMDVLVAEPGYGDYPKQQLPGSAYWVSDETFCLLLDAALRQLARAGFGIVVAQGHGPSTMIFDRNRQRYRELFGLDCHQVWEEGPAEGPCRDLGLQTDHAGANETSLMMALRPELVALADLDQERWPMAVRGKDPRIHASAHRGEQALERQLERMSGLLRQALAELGKKQA